MAGDDLKVFGGFTAEELDYHYSPTRWVTRVPVEKVIEDHRSFIVPASEHARSSIQTKELNVVYSDESPRTKLDIFFPSSFGPETPILIFIHGGYWQSSRKEDSSFLVLNAVNAGIAAAIVGYDLCPTVPLSKISKQIEKAVAFLHKKYPTSKVIISGHSAGGHLAAMMLFVDWKVLANIEAQFIGGVFLVSGIFDLSPIRVTPAVNVNGILQLSEEDIPACSPLALLKAGKQLVFCPVVVAAGAQDPAEFLRQGHEFAEGLKGDHRNRTVEELVVGGKDHFNIIHDLRLEGDELAKKLLGFCLQA